jgi:hypothetical protein
MFVRKGVKKALLSHRVVSLLCLVDACDVLADLQRDEESVSEECSHNMRSIVRKGEQAW